MNYPHKTTDSKGNILSILYKDGSKWVYTYDEMGNMTSKTYPSGDKYVWTYDEKGNMTSKTYPNGDKWVYTYDEKGNMTSATNPWGKTYDMAGNLIPKITELSMDDIAKKFGIPVSTLKIKK